MPVSKAAYPRATRTAMKFETLMLHALFGASPLVCVLVLGAMLNPHTTSVARVATSHAPVVVAVSSAG